MELIYHTRRINFLATIKSFEPGDMYTFGKKTDFALIRTICSKLEGTFTVNKTDEGLRVTRLA